MADTKQAEFPSAQKKQDRLSRIMRAASVFHEERYGTRAIHVGMISDFLIDKTDVGEFIKGLSDRRPGSRSVEIIEMRLGDPTADQYEGIGPYPGYDRHSRRFKNFHPASSYAGYLIEGDEQLKARIRLGRTKTPGYVHPPQHMEVYITAGVAGGLRLVSSALLLPQSRPDDSVIEEMVKRLSEDRPLENDFRGQLVQMLLSLHSSNGQDEVIIPKWTYVSHMAEISLAHGQFRLCGITTDGQVDTGDLARIINSNTQAVLFATVGNPLTVAMTPEKFDEILRLVHEKSMEFNHPIVVIADVIYEQFRRDRASRIDAIQRALKLGVSVPVVEMSSFSKMLAIPGERAGYARVLWDPDFFPARRFSFLRSMRLIHGPGLGAVACSVQRPLGSMYASINAKLPVEEKLVQIAAVLTALSDLTRSKELPITLGDTQLIFREKENRDKGLVPKKIYAPIGNLGIEKGFFSVRKVMNKTRKIAHRDLRRLDIDLDSESVMEVGDILAEAGLVEKLERDEVVFLKLKAPVPPIAREEDANSRPSRQQLSLYGISSVQEWIEIARKCNVETEDVLYQAHKKTMRHEVHSRVMHFAQGIDRMRREGAGVYLHPAYYNEKGELEPGRFNAFYVLWGFEKLRKYEPKGPSQARQLAEKCEALNMPIIACVPGECFLPPEMKEGETSYIRSVALLPLERLDRALQIIRLVAREMDNGP